MFVKALLFDLNKPYEVSSLGQKQILLDSIFPEGLVYENGKLLNRRLSPLFDLITTSPSYSHGLVGVPGLEPGTSTSQTWRATNCATLR